MARKKKKPTRKELKQQRRAAIARKRKERGWQHPQARASRRQGEAEIIEDILPLFPQLKDGPPSSDDMEQLMMILVASEELIEEPEFEEVIIDPILCVDTLAQVGQELGLDPQSLGELPDEEREDTQMKMLEMTTQRLLTDELRQDIVDGLNNLRLRLKRSGQRKKAAKAAALQSLLGESEDNKIWPMLGLVQAIVQRSLVAGFELLEVSAEVMEAGDFDQDVDPLTLSEKLAQSSLAQKADTMLKKIPGLSGFLKKQADNIWEEGVDAVFMGDLYLALFTPDELKGGLDIVATTLEIDITTQTSSQDIPSSKPTKEKMKILIAQLDDYITKLFTPERLDQLRTRLNLLLDDSTYEKKWSSFILMLREYMAVEDAVENEKSFLVQALLGEMRAIVFEEVED